MPEPARPGFRWEVVRGLNVQAVNADAMVSGQPVLRLAATPNDRGHTLGVRLTGLNKNQTYRVSAWVKSVAGGNVELAALDHPDTDNPVNNGYAIFELSNHQVLDAFGSDSVFETGSTALGHYKEKRNMQLNSIVVDTEISTSYGSICSSRYAID